MSHINAAASSSLNPSTLNPQPSTLNPQPSTLNPQPSTPNPKPRTLNPKPHNLNPHSPPHLPSCPNMECILALAPFHIVMHSRLGAIDTRPQALCRVCWGSLMWRTRALFRSKIDGC